MKMHMCGIHSLYIAMLLVSGSPALFSAEYQLYLTDGSIETWVDTEAYNPRGIFYNGAVYKISRYQDGDWYKIATRRLEFNHRDKPGFGNFTKHMNCSRIFPDCNNYRGYCVAPLVYDGRLFVFYDIEGYGQNSIYCKTSLNPAEKYLPEDGWGDKVLGQRKNPQMPFTAYVAQDSIFLIYLDQAASGSYLLGARSYGPDRVWQDIAVPSADGSAFIKQNEKPNWMDSKTVIDDEGREVPVFGIYCYNSDSKRDVFRLYKIVDGKAYAVHEETDISTPNGGFHILETGTCGMPSGNSVSVVVPQDDPDNTKASIVRRYQFKIGKGTKKLEPQGLEHMTFNNQTRYRTVCPVIYYAQAEDSVANLQQFFSLVVTYAGVTIFTDDIRAVTFKNEFFRYKDVSRTLDSAIEEDGDLLWSMIGAIEGVPPFQDEEGWISTVGYLQSQEKTLSTTQTFGGSWYMGFTGGKEDVVSAGASYTWGFKEIKDFTAAVKKDIEFQFANIQENGKGEYGWLLFSKPKWKWDWYDRISPDGSTVLQKDIVFGYVDSIIIEAEDYKLKDPPNGMRKRPDSSEFKEWDHRKMSIQEDLSDSKISGGDINTIMYSSKGSRGKSEFSQAESNSAEKINSWGVKLEIKLGKEKVFELASASEVNWELSSKTSTAVTKTMTAAIEYAGDKTGRMMKVKPYWLKAPDKGKADWCPDSFSGDKPWCITWRVFSYLPSGAGIENAPNRIGRKGAAGIVTTSNRVRSSTASDGYSAYVAIYSVDRRGRISAPAYLSRGDDNYLLLGTLSMDTGADSCLLWLKLDDGTLTVDEIVDCAVVSSTDIQGLALDEDHEYLTAGLFVWADDSFRDSLAVRQISTGDISVHSIDAGGKLIKS